MMKLDKPTLAVIAALAAALTGGGNLVAVAGNNAAEAIQRDVSDIRERLVRVETLLEGRARFSERKPRDETIPVRTGGDDRDRLQRDSPAASQQGAGHSLRN